MESASSPINLSLHTIFDEQFLERVPWELRLALKHGRAPFGLAAGLDDP